MPVARALLLIIASCYLPAASGDGGTGTFAAQERETAIKAARAETAAIHERTKAPGLSVAVEVNAKLVWSEGFGFADTAAKTPAARETVYRIGSVSKLLTAAALAKLHEQGKIDLDAPVTRYVPEFPNGANITARRLAGHLAGIRHYAGAGEFLTQVHCDSPAQALAIFKDDPLKFEPGEKYSYSSYGYVLLSAAIESASGTPFPQYVRSVVLEPRAMTHTTERWDDPSIGGQSAPYSLFEGEVVAAPKIDPTCRVAAGSYMSSAEDLAKFLSAHADAKFLRTETVEMMFTPQSLSDGSKTKVGLGWRVTEDERGRRFVHHGGDIVGGRAFVLLYPEQRVAVAICTNLGSAPFSEKEVLRVAAPFLETPGGD